MSVYIYYGSRAAQPTRVRAFIDWVVERLGNSSAYVLEPSELRAAEAKGRQRARRVNQSR